MVTLKSRWVTMFNKCKEQGAVYCIKWTIKWADENLSFSCHHPSSLPWWPLPTRFWSLGPQAPSKAEVPEGCGQWCDPTHLASTRLWTWCAPQSPLHDLISVAINPHEDQTAKNAVNPIYSTTTGGQYTFHSGHATQLKYHKSWCLCLTCDKSFTHFLSNRR